MDRRSESWSLFSALLDIFFSVDENGDDHPQEPCLIAFLSFLSWIFFFLCGSAIPDHLFEA